MVINNIKFERFRKYTGIFDLHNMNIKKKYKILINDIPKYVEFNQKPYQYSKALKKGFKELRYMFKDCSSYIDAKKVIETIDPLNLTDSYWLYGCWVVVKANDKSKTIFWDIRWY